jgi:hypothetical protein
MFGQDAKTCMVRWDVTSDEMTSGTGEVPEKVESDGVKSGSVCPQKNLIRSSQNFSCHFSLKKWAVILSKVGRFPLQKNDPTISKLQMSLIPHKI